MPELDKDKIIISRPLIYYGGTLVRDDAHLKSLEFWTNLQAAIIFGSIIFGFALAFFLSYCQSHNIPI